MESTVRDSLDVIPADRELIEDLAKRDLISPVARDYAFTLLQPAKNWGFWIARLLSVLGTALILSGLIYFFAFNWTKIPPAVKLASIQFGLLSCLIGSYLFGIQTSSVGRGLVLSASVIVGIFLAVFGQIYQTGADAYTLFMTWSVLILPWVCISEFAPLWGFWLAVTNTFLILWWEQGPYDSGETRYLIYSCLALFNLLFLALRESLSSKRLAWISNRWTRVVLVLPILFYLLIPTIMWIAEPHRADSSIAIGALVSVAVHIGFYAVYRFLLRDIVALTSTILSVCIIIEAAVIKVISEIFNFRYALPYLMLGVITLGIFTFAVVQLRNVAKKFELS